MRPEHVPTLESRAQVKALAQFLTQADIAVYLEISDKTLRKHYANELKHGSVKANAAVGTNLLGFASGRKGSEKAQVTAGIFWAKTRMGWRETVNVNDVTEQHRGARDRLAGKLGGAAPVTRRETDEASIPDPVGSA